MDKVTNRLVRLEELLKNHDWLFEYSDDHTIWKRGNKSDKIIRKEISELSILGFDAECHALFEKYRSK